ncbi:MAG: hypothetical protein ACLQUT_09450 [Thermoleophilia bacterium]
MNAIDHARFTVVVRDYDGIWHQARRPWMGHPRAEALRLAILAKSGAGRQCAVWTPAQWLCYYRGEPIED